MEDNSDGDEAEQIFYDTVREYVVSIKLKVYMSKRQFKLYYEKQQNGRANQQQGCPHVIVN